MILTIAVASNNRLKLPARGRPVGGCMAAHPPQLSRGVMPLEGKTHMAKRLMIFAVGFLLSAALAHGQWKQGGKDLPDAPWRKSVKDFGAMLLFTDKPDAFFEAWSKPDPQYRPNISSPGQVRRGSTVVAVVVLTNCRSDDKGECNAEVDFKLLRPDGSIYGEHKGAELWQGKPAPHKGNLQLSVGNLAFGVEPDDTLGRYTLQALVRDKVANIEISLTQNIAVLPAK